MDRKGTILTISTNERNLELLGQFLGKEGYQTVSGGSLAAFVQLLDENPAIDLALVDLAGFDRSIWDQCERLREKNIPLLVVSPKQSSAIQQEILAHGARGVLNKPLVVRELLALIRSLLESR